MRVSLIHLEVRSSLEEVFQAVRDKVLEAAEQRPNFIALPEYFSVPGFIERYRSAREVFEETYDRTIEFLRDLSAKLPDVYIVGGTVVEEHQGRFFNTCTLWKNTKIVGAYRKRSLIDLEVKLGISRGNEPFVLSTELGRIGLLVCADIFDVKIVKETVSLGAEVIFLPVAASSTHPTVKGHPLSEKIAAENGVFIAKVGNVRSEARGGRSAVIAPWGVIREVSEALEDSVLTVDLDMQRLREYRERLSEASSTRQ